MGDKINGSGIKVTYIKELTAVLFENYVLFTEMGWESLSCCKMYQQN